LIHPAVKRNSGSETNCVEVAQADTLVCVRDTKDQAGVVLRVSAETWRRFAAGIKA
jgi:hypothetical protein